MEEDLGMVWAGVGKRRDAHGAQGPAGYRGPAAGTTLESRLLQQKVV